MRFKIHSESVENDSKKYERPLKSTKIKNEIILKKIIKNEMLFLNYC